MTVRNWHQIADYRFDLNDAFEESDLRLQSLEN
jgi:hypothetical protein